MGWVDYWGCWLHILLCLQALFVSRLGMINGKLLDGHPPMSASLPVNNDEVGKVVRGALVCVQVLSRIRGTPHVEEELEDMAEAARISNLAPHPMRNLFKAQYRPQLIISLMFMMFQQFTGINAIIFYAPVLFNSIGSGHTAALLNTVIIGAGEVSFMHTTAHSPPLFSFFQHFCISALGCFSWNP